MFLRKRSQASCEKASETPQGVSRAEVKFLFAHEFSKADSEMASFKTLRNYKYIRNSRILNTRSTS